MKGDLVKRIEHIETLIYIYSDRDLVRTKELEKELNSLNSRLINIMVDEEIQ